MAKRATRKRADREQFWSDLIGRQQRSGQSIREFCDSEGVSQPSFFSWRKRLRALNGQAEARFVPVQIEMPGSLASAGQIEIVLDGGRRVRVAPGFDGQTLSDVLAVLEPQPC